MKISPAKDVKSRPRTRRELLSHLWGVGLNSCNIFKEGPFYAATNGKIIAATHTRCIDSRNFEEWEQFVRNIPQGA